MNALEAAGSNPVTAAENPNHPLDRERGIEIMFMKPRSHTKKEHNT